MLSLSVRVLTQLRLLLLRRQPMLVASPVLPAGWIHSPNYQGPDRRLADRRAYRERRTRPRGGLGWWRHTDRRGDVDRRAVSRH